MDATASPACEQVIIDLSDNGGDGDIDSGEGNNRNVEDNDMNVRAEHNNGSISGGAEPDIRSGIPHEMSWVGLNKGLDELTEKEVSNLKFGCEEEAGMFYETYSKFVGFTVRKSYRRCDKDDNNLVLYRAWVCSKEGFPENKNTVWDRRHHPKPGFRTGCLASFKIRYDKKSGKYVVSNFVKEHNHELAVSVVVPCLQPQKRARIVVEEVVSTNKDVERVPANSDIHHVDKGVLAHIVLAYLCAKNDYDPGLFYKYYIDEEHQLCNIFWTDSKSRADYAFFSDVLAVNTKFRKNAYEKPFIILSGLNNHNQTTVFGCALLGDETAETYVWLLETFLEAMNNRAPVSVITDGDRSIEEAIEKMLPTSQHRICRWHLYEDAVSYAGDSSFGTEFKKCIEENWKPEEFEAAWTKLVDKYALQDHAWFKETYSRRTKWAEAYLREHFSAGLSSIQDHGMNTYFTQFLQVRLKLHEFVRHFDNALARLREDEAKADAESEKKFPAFSTSLRDLERHAAHVFTRNIFLKIREQIMGDAMLILNGKEYLEDDACWLYKFSEYMKPDMIWKVRYDPSNQSLACPCFKLITDGVPCCHMISVIKAERLREFPKGCIIKRWMKRARSEIDSGIDAQAINMATQVARYRILSSSCSEMNYYASQTIQGFNKTRNLISEITSDVKQIYNSKGEVDEPSPDVSQDADGSTSRSGMHDLNGQCNASGVVTSDGTGMVDDGERPTQNGIFSEMPSPPINLVWDVND